VRRDVVTACSSSSAYGVTSGGGGPQARPQEGNERREARAARRSASVPRLRARCDCRGACEVGARRAIGDNLQLAR
jgi:hypothetical protein